jgi:hypothetical protein
MRARVCGKIRGYDKRDELVKGNEMLVARAQIALRDTNREYYAT